MFGIEDYTQKIVDFSNFDPSQLGSALLFGLSVVFIGMLTIFSVLIILWIFLAAFKVIFHDLPEKRKSNIKTNVNETVTAEAASTHNEDEIIAVIAAAIAMAESDNDGMKFRVVSFKRI